jgi:hypothetical protein
VASWAAQKKVGASGGPGLGSTATPSLSLHQSWYIKANRIKEIWTKKGGVNQESSVWRWLVVNLFKLQELRRKK